MFGASKVFVKGDAGVSIAAPDRSAVWVDQD